MKFCVKKGCTWHDLIIFAIVFKQFRNVMKRYLRPYRKYLVWSVVLNFLAQLLNVFSFLVLIPILNILFRVDQTQYVYRDIDWSNFSREELMNNAYAFVQDLIQTHGPLATLAYMGVALIVMTGLKTFAYFASSAIMIPLRTGVVRDIRVQVYEKVMRLPLSFFSEERKGDIIARMSADVQTVETTIASSLDMLIRHPIAILVCFATLFMVSWQLTLFVIVVAPLAGWVMGRVGRRLKSKSKRVQENWGDIIAQLDETLGGLRVIKAFNSQRKMRERFGRANQEYRDATRDMATRQAAAHPMSEFLGTIVIVIVLWFGGMLILGESSPFDASTFIFYLVILYSAINPLKEFSRASYQIPQGLSAMERIDFILDAEPCEEIDATEKADDAKQVAEFNDSIELRNVSFAYTEGQPVLRNINLTIRRGQTIALVGQSGSGKTTLVDLIPRFYEVKSGEVLLDGKNINTLSLKGLRSLVGYVNQQAILFNDTFRNNIAFGVENASQDEVEEAARIANAHDFIVPQGYDAMIGDGGCRLSGGQRQRLSIARAILKNPPILILDEATSALDTESERLVQEALENLMRNRTTIAIAHRLSTIKNADLICVLHNGEIVEQGKHDELIARGGYYKKLYDMQQL